MGIERGRCKPPDLTKWVRISSWNVSVIKDRSKRQAIFSVANKGNVEILCLQETHLIKDTVRALEHKYYRRQFHSTYTSYSRGVSVLIGPGLVFSCSQSKVDEYGRYVFLSCLIDNNRYV